MCFSHFIGVLDKAESHIFKARDISANFIAIAWDITFKTKLKIKSQRGGSPSAVWHGANNVWLKMTDWRWSHETVQKFNLLRGLEIGSLEGRSPAGLHVQWQKHNWLTKSHFTPFSSFCLKNQLTLQFMTITVTFLYRPEKLHQKSQTGPVRWTANA